MRRTNDTIGYDSKFPRDQYGGTISNGPRASRYVKILAALIMAAFVIMAIPSFAVSDDVSAATDSNDFEYALISEPNKTVSLTGYGGEETSIVIPATVRLNFGGGESDYSIKNIGNNAFKDNESITSVYMQSIESIGLAAFNGCKNLASVTISGSTTSIGGTAFGNCESITSMLIPSNVSSIGDNAFFGCTSLPGINVDSSNTSFKDVDGVLYDKAGETLIVCPAGKAGVYEIPDGVKTIKSNAFLSCKSLTSVTVPESVTSIGGYAFRYCESLTSMEIPDGVGSLEISTFEGCKSLRSVTIPDSVSSISNSVFKDCESLDSVTIPTGLTAIGNYVFQNCKSLRSVTLDAGTAVAPATNSQTFNGCVSLTELRITASGDTISATVQGFMTAWQLPSMTGNFTTMVINTEASLSLPDLGESGKVIFDPISKNIDVGDNDFVGKTGDALTSSELAGKTFIYDTSLNAWTVYENPSDDGDDGIDPLLLAAIAAIVIVALLAVVFLLMKRRQ